MGMPLPLRMTRRLQSPRRMGALDNGQGFEFGPSVNGTGRRAELGTGRLKPRTGSLVGSVP